MLKLIFLLAILVGAAAAVILLIVDHRRRHRRRISRSRREGDYAERRTIWQSYLHTTRTRRTRRITDQSASED